MKLPSLLLNNAVINLDQKGEFEDSFEAYYAKEKSKKRFLKIIKDWNVFNKEYFNLSAKQLKECLIISKIDKDTEALLDKLSIKDNKDYLIQLMSIPEYQLC